MVKIYIVLLVLTSFTFDLGLGFGLHLFVHPLFWCVYVFNYRKVKINNAQLMPLYFIAIILIYGFIRLNDFGYIGYLLNIIFYIYGYIVFQLVRTSVSARKIIEYFIIITFVVFAVEFSVRMLNPDFTIQLMFSDHPWFYAYKYNSILYDDSNFVALHIISMLFFVIFLEKIAGFNSVYKWLFLLLLIGALSRSALFGFSAFGFMYMMRGNKYLVFLFVAAMLAFLVFSFSEMVLHDKSLISKLTILESFNSLLQQSDLGDMVLGRGFGPVQNLVYVRGVQGHTHFYDLLLWFGLFGYFIFSSLFIFIMRGARNTSYVSAYLLCFTIVGFSMVDIFAHYFWFYLGMLVSANEGIKRVGIKNAS